MAEKPEDEKPPKKTAEDYANESLAANLDEVLLYDRNEDLEPWLERCSPAIISRLDGVGWIAIECEGGIDTSGLNFEALHKEWEELQTSRNPINFFTIRDLATRHGIISGGWIIHPRLGVTAELLWKKIANQFVNGLLTSIATMVRISPHNPTDPHDEHVIVVKHKDFTNEEEVYKLNDVLREVGIKTRMRYKPDVYSYLGIYRNNKFKIKPTIYTSHYDAQKRTTTIDRLFTEPSKQLEPEK